MSYKVYYNSRYPQCKRICKKNKKNGGNQPFLYRGILRYTVTSDDGTDPIINNDVSFKNLKNIDNPRRLNKNLINTKNFIKNKLLFNLIEQLQKILQVMMWFKLFIHFKMMV